MSYPTRVEGLVNMDGNVEWKKERKKERKKLCGNKEKRLRKEDKEEKTLNNEHIQKPFKSNQRTDFEDRNERVKEWRKICMKRRRKGK